MSDYTLREMMTLAAARLVKDGDIIFCGTGIAMLAAMAAKNINAPDSIVFFETGAVDSLLAEIPMAVADSRVMYRAAINSGLSDAFATMQNRFTGRQVMGILGAAQIDPYGNLNSTVIGDYDHPEVRFSGSGGACDVMSFVDRVIVFMKNEKRKFVPRLDYLTSPGWLDGAGAREAAGLGPGGPVAVITDMGVMGFEKASRRMYLKNTFPGISPEKIRRNTGFPIDTTRAHPLAPPSPGELQILRNVCDPQGLILA